MVGYVTAHYCYESYYTREEISNALYLNGCIVRRNILHKHSINFREGGLDLMQYLYLSTG